MGEVYFCPAQPMVKAGGCSFCEDRYPGATVHVIQKAGVDGDHGGLEIRMCDLCVQSLSQQRNDWARRHKSMLTLRRRKTARDEYGYIKAAKPSENRALTQ